MQQQKSQRASVDISSSSPVAEDDGLNHVVDDTQPLVEKAEADAERHANSLWRAKFLAISGLILAILCSVMRGVFPVIVDAVVWRETAITSPQSTLYHAWLNPAAAGVTIYRTYTFYNLTNPDEVVDGAPPNFIERGPYVYTEYRMKDPDSVQWFPNGTVGYTYSSTFEFEASLSMDALTGEQLSDEDVLLLINAPLIGLTHRLSRTSEYLGQVDLPILGVINVTKQECCVLLDLMINATVGPQGIFVQRSVKEVLWGYLDPIWESVHTTLGALNYTAGKIFRSEWNGSYAVPSPYSFRSGQMCPLWDTLDACNNTVNLFTLEGSGELHNDDSVVPMGHVGQWAGQRRFWWWGDEIDGYTGGMEIEARPKKAVPEYTIEDSDTCHSVIGSDGFRFGPHVTKDSALYLFLDMLWRSVPLSFWKKGTVKDLDALSFSLSRPVLDNTTEENQRCYHMKNYGLLNFSRPLYGPAFAAKARFLDAQMQPEQVNYTMQRPICGQWQPSEDADGKSVCLNWTLSQRLPILEYLEEYYHRESDPDAFREQFESHLDIHPLTGITLNGVAQGEAITMLKPVTVVGCSGLFQRASKLIETYFPLVNVKRSTEVSDHYADKLRTAMLLMLIAEIVLYVFIALGAVLCIAGLLWLRHLCKYAPLKTL